MMVKDQQNVLSKLKEHHLDALQEIGNIRARHSATALSQLLNRKVGMSVPRTVLCPIEEFATKIISDPEEPIVAVLTETTGDIEIPLVGIFDIDIINHLMWVMRKKKLTCELMDISLIDRFFIHEISNIVLLHYISAISQFTGIFMYPQVPALTIDMGKAILDSLIRLKGIDHDTILSIEVDIFTDNFQLKSTIVMLPDPQNLDRLMTRLFGEGWTQL